MGRIPRRSGCLFQVIAQARAQRLVKDRPRLKDASHAIADMAVPTTLDGGVAVSFHVAEPKWACRGRVVRRANC